MAGGKKRGSLAKEEDKFLRLAIGEIKPLEENFPRRDQILNHIAKKCGTTVENLEVFSLAAGEELFWLTSYLAATVRTKKLIGLKVVFFKKK